MASTTITAGSHRRPRRNPRQWWRGASRTKKALSLVVLLIVVLATTAAALFLFRAPITGSGQVTSQEVRWLDSSVAVQGTTGVITCSVTRVSDTELNVTVTNAFAGSSCDIGAASGAGAPGVYTTDDAVSLVVQDIAFIPEFDVAFLAGCGATIPSGTGSTGRDVPFRITIPEDLADGTYVVSMDAGVTAVPATDYVPANCPSV